MANLAQFQDVLSRTFVATGTITPGQPVGLDGAVASADAHILGICKFDVDATDYGSVICIGKANVVAGGAITAGDYVKVGTAGKYLSADATALAAGKVVGKALTTVTDDGDTVEIIVSGF